MRISTPSTCHLAPNLWASTCNAQTCTFESSGFTNDQVFFPGGMSMKRTTNWTELRLSAVCHINYLVHNAHIVVFIQLSKPEESKAVKKGSCGSIVAKPRHGSYYLLLQTY